MKSEEIEMPGARARMRSDDLAVLGGRVAPLHA